LSRVAALCHRGGMPASESNMSLFEASFDPARDRAHVTGAGKRISRAIAQSLVNGSRRRCRTG